MKCLAQGHKAVPPLRHDPVTPQSRVKRSTTATDGLLSPTTDRELLFFTFWPIHDILVLIADVFSHFLTMHAQLSNGTRELWSEPSTMFLNSPCKQTAD